MTTRTRARSSERTFIELVWKIPTTAARQSLSEVALCPSRICCTNALSEGSCIGDATLIASHWRRGQLVFDAERNHGFLPAAQVGSRPMTDFCFYRLLDTVSRVSQGTQTGDIRKHAQYAVFLSVWLALLTCSPEKSAV